MSNLWLDPQLPYELEEIFLTYGTPSFAMRGETIFKMNERKDHFYYIAEGLAVALSKTSATSGVFLAKIIPDSRAFGFTCFPSGWLAMYEMRILRDAALYSMPYTTIYNMLGSGCISSRVFKRYQRSVKHAEYLAANTLIATHSSDRIISSVKSFNLAEVKYTSFGLEKTIKLDEYEMKEMLLMKAAYDDVYRDKPLHSKVTSAKKVISPYIGTQKIMYN